MRVAADVGGTFTDLVFVDDDAREAGYAKVPSTPPRYEAGVLAAVAASGVPAGSIEHFVHGTTVVINTLLQRTGARTALVTTRGFRDVLEIGRGNRPDLYNLHYKKPVPYVERELRLEVTERLDPGGNVVTPLDEGDVADAAERLRELGAEAVAVCFLHSYANPAHEERCAELLRRQLPGVFVTASFEIGKVWREYERSSTAVLNAYVQPVTAAYLGALEQGLRGSGVRGTVHVMKSNGGTGTFAMAARQPIHLVESGPVGGVVGAQVIGRRLGIDRIITLDVGGTTAKTSLIEDGRVRFVTDYHLDRDAVHAGHPINVPVVDIVEVGAGGGSIAWLDPSEALRVGPRSAGARPGPACYGLGGELPTLTDANLILGRIGGDAFLGGGLPLSLDLALRAFRPIARRFGVSEEEAALGVVRIAEASMSHAIRLVSVERGHDPRRFTLVAMGGGGPLHAGALALELRIPRVIVPPSPGTFSAWGMLAADTVEDAILTRVLDVGDATAAVASSVFAELQAEAAGRLAASGRDPRRATYVRYADLRYRGQEHTVRTEIGTVATGDVLTRFHEAHERAYTFRLDSPVEWVNFIVRAVVAQDFPAAAVDAHGRTPPDSARRDSAPRHRRVRFQDADVVAPVHARSCLTPGTLLRGPAIVEEHTATTVVPPGMVASLDSAGNLVMEVGGPDGSQAA